MPAAGGAAPNTPTAGGSLARPQPKLELVDLHVSYLTAAGGAIEAVGGIDLQVPDKPGCGEIVVLLGPSGCGKSTVLKSIAGLQRPTRGEVRAGGEPVRGVGRDRGMVFQQYTSFGWLTVAENVGYGLRLAGVPKAARREQVEHYLQLVGLYDYRQLYPKSLSGGMKQRVAIARTLINRPRLLLMDEPFGALDPQTRWEMQTLLLAIAQREDATIVLVTHDVGEAVYVGDTCYVLTPRPARIVERLEVPSFGDRSPALKAAAEFRAVEQALLARLYAPASRPGA
ncbi:MAG: ABC transporter ATP-binding protein [Proteobacteria bacterium]|nr:ABC transporter ATP-binding protein [Pseudomonadota bacterium]